MIAAAAYIKKILDTVSVKGIIVKGSLVFSYSRVWVLSCTIYIPIGAGQYNLTFQAPFIRNTWYHYLLYQCKILLLPFHRKLGLEMGGT